MRINPTKQIMLYIIHTLDDCNWIFLECRLIPTPQNGRPYLIASFVVINVRFKVYYPTKVI